MIACFGLFDERSFGVTYIKYLTVLFVRGMLRRLERVFLVAIVFVKR